MKQTLLTLCLIVFALPVWSETLTMDDLVIRDDLYYQKFTDVPFTGDVSGIWNGKIKKGKITGEWLSYYESGQLKLKINYKEGKMDGVWEYFDEEGFLLVTKTYIKGIEQE